MSSDDIVIDVRGLSKRYEIYATPRDRLKQMVYPRLHRWGNRLTGRARRHPQPDAPRYFREFWALHDVAFQVRRGETFGIIGRNGSGKSTLLQVLAGVLAPTAGEVDVEGRVAALLELGSGFDLELTGRQNVLLNGQILGMTTAQIDARYDRIVAFAEIGEFIDEPVKTYSSGMFLRLAFAVQAHIDAAIVIIDEALAVGDVFFRQKCYARLDELKKAGAAILLVSHSMGDIEQYCERALLLDHGQQRFLGSSSEAAKHYYLANQATPVATGGTARLTERVDLLAGSDRGSVVPRPRDEALLDLGDKKQVTNGHTRCVAMALTDPHGDPCGHFEQGQRAVFYAKFVVEGQVGVPLFGVLIKNDRGIIVHGKNGWQFDQDVEPCTALRSSVTCCQEVGLDLAQGDYVFEMGLIFVDESAWARRARIPHEEMSAIHTVACIVANAGHFSVGLKMRDGVAVLTHHGVADLPGSMATFVTSERSAA